MLQAREAGKIRHIGITNHRLSVAREAIESGLYATLQFPLSYLSSDEDAGLAELSQSRGMGFIAMKALSGGLITNSAAAYAYLSGFDNAVAIWGVQRPSELDEFLSYVNNPPAMTQALRAVIDRDRAELSSEFCRGCGYCLPCPAGIEIPTCARMSLLLRRAPERAYLTDEWSAKMELITSCQHCGSCTSRCPYALDTPSLLAANLASYRLTRSRQ
jgi:predicted aldo/keto reductase-like oxidoreductase